MVPHALLLATVLVGALACGAALAERVKIGLTVPLTGVQAGLGKEAETVWRAFARHANSNGLAGNHTLDVTVLDDGFDPARTKANAEQLAAQGVAVMAATPGIPNVQSMMPVLEASRIPLIGPASGSLALRGKSPAVFHVKASFGAEIDKLARLCHAMSLRRLVVIADDVGDRKALVERFGTELKRSSEGASALVGSVVIPVQGGTAPEAVSRAVELARTFKPDGIFVMTIPGLAGGLLKGVRDMGYRGFLMTWSLVALESVVTAVGAQGKGIIFGSVVPSPTSQQGGMRSEFSAFAKEQGLQPSYRAMEIYITGRILAEALSRLGGGAPTGARVWGSLENLREVRLSGWRVSYSATEREGSSFVDTMMLMGDGRFR